MVQNQESAASAANKRAASGRTMLDDVMDDSIPEDEDLFMQGS